MFLIIKINIIASKYVSENTMHAFHLERDDRALARRSPENPQRIDFRQPLVGVGAQRMLVRGDVLEADPLTLRMRPAMTREAAPPTATTRPQLVRAAAPAPQRPDASRLATWAAPALRVPLVTKLVGANVLIVLAGECSATISAMVRRVNAEPSSSIPITPRCSRSRPGWD